jgi:hypothetical protein
VRLGRAVTVKRTEVTMTFSGPQVVFDPKKVGKVGLFQQKVGLFTEK